MPPPSVPLHVRVPSGTDLVLEHLVLDANGTLTDRGIPIDGVEERLDALAAGLYLHVVSADTYGTAEMLADRVHASFRRVAAGPEKDRYVEELGADRVVAIGNGSNDELMLRRAALGIAVVGREGTSVRAVRAADVLAASILDALDLLLTPTALGATIRP